MKALIIFVLLLVFLGVIGFTIFKQVNKMLNINYEEEGEEENKQSIGKSKGEKNAQSLLQFNDIKDDVIDLGNDRYRMVIEVSSTNYYLKTEEEKQTIEMAFQSFLNALSFPITIYCQTRVIDDSKMLMQLKESIVNSVEEFPMLKHYGEVYYNEMKQINNYTGNNKAKRKYIIVPFEDLDELTEFSSREKYEEALKRIRERAQFIVEALAPIDLKGKILNTNELIELVYASYNKGDLANAELIASGEYMRPIVTGVNRLNNVDGVTMTDYILFEAQNEIKNKVLNRNLPEHEVEVYSSLINHLGDIRESIVELESDEKSD